MSDDTQGTNELREVASAKSVDGEPLPAACSCTHEAGDSDCARHPTCPGCGEALDGTELAAEVRRLREACDLAHRRKHAVEEELAATQRTVGFAVADRARLQRFEEREPLVQELVDAVLPGHGPLEGAAYRRRLNEAWAAVRKFDLSAEPPAAAEDADEERAALNVPKAPGPVPVNAGERVWHPDPAVDALLDHIDRGLVGLRTRTNGDKLYPELKRLAQEVCAAGVTHPPSAKPAEGFVRYAPFDSLPKDPPSAEEAQRLRNAVEQDAGVRARAKAYSMDDFRSNPVAVVDAAERGEVVLVDADGNPRMTIARVLPPLED